MFIATVVLCDIHNIDKNDFTLHYYLIITNFNYKLIKFGKVNGRTTEISKSKGDLVSVSLLVFGNYIEKNRSAKSLESVKVKFTGNKNYK